MFKKKEKVDRYWENGDYMKIRTLDLMNNINESQKRLSFVGAREYLKQCNDIRHKIEQMEEDFQIREEEKEEIFHD